MPKAVVCRELGPPGRLRLETFESKLLGPGQVRVAIRAAAQHRVPASYSWRQHVQEGGLMSYGADTADIFRRSAAYVDRILKGERPGDLPVEAPTKFQMIVNLKTAKALGLTVPLTLQAVADEVIE